MSTRSTTKFAYGSPPNSEGSDVRRKPEAIVYRHSDGYPEVMLTDLQRFFETVEEETNDSRYSDPPYIAARWVVWLAREFSTPYERGEGGKYGYNRESSRVGSLDFLSVGVVSQDPGDIEHSYWLDCSSLGGDGRPTVYHLEKRGGGGGWQEVSLSPDSARTTQ